MKKRIKIAYILAPSSFGGSERVSLNFLKHIDISLFEVQPILFLCPLDDKPYFARAIKRYGFTYKSVSERTQYGRREPVIVRIPRAIYKIYTFLRQTQYDIIHSHGYFTDICSLPVARMLGIKCISTCHGFIDINKKLKFYNMLDKKVLRLCDQVICVSDNIYDLLLRSGLNQNKMQIIPNTVDINRERNKTGSIRQRIRKQLYAEEDHLVIGYVGRLSEEKGLKTLVLAFGSVVRIKPKSRLWLVGEGPLLSELQKLAKSMGLSEHILFTGFREDVENILQGMDIFVLPSYTEGTPLALLEAMSLGVPVIASSVGQIPKIITSGENGILTKSGDAQAIAQNILLISMDKTLARTFSQNSIKTIKSTYSISTWTRKIEEIYYNVTTNTI